VSAPNAAPPEKAAPGPPPATNHADGLSVPVPSIDESSEKLIDEIEMLGEEEAAGLRKPGTSDVSPGMRYLHASRTIHQLVSDRNRAVGLYLAVASLLWTASSTLLLARPNPNAALIVPLEQIQRWCFPVTLGTLTILAVFTSFLLIRTRVGLIYEVAKMNLLLGLPVGRVRRVNPLSLFFIMHLLIALAGGGCGALFTYHMFQYFDPDGAEQMFAAILMGVAIVLVLELTYIFTVLKTTSESRLLSGS
jgi:hypothetical protein